MHFSYGGGAGHFAYYPIIDAISHHIVAPKVKYHSTQDLYYMHVKLYMWKLS